MFYLTLSLQRPAARALLHRAQGLLNVPHAHSTAADGPREAVGPSAPPGPLHLPRAYPVRHSSGRLNRNPSAFD